MNGASAMARTCKDVNREDDIDQPHTLRSGVEFFRTDRGNPRAASTVSGPSSGSSSSLFMTSDLAISPPSAELVINIPLHPSLHQESRSLLSKRSVPPGEGGEALVAGTSQLVTGSPNIEKSKTHNGGQPPGASPTDDSTPRSTSLTKLSVKDSIPQNEIKDGRTVKAPYNCTNDDDDNESPPSADRLPLKYTVSSSETQVKGSSAPCTSPSVEPEGITNTFFSFVILHVKEDEETASRLLDTLGRLGIAGGTTFCDEFELPGQSPLTSIQEAIDNSAFTVLLLSKNWDSRWAEFQMNAALMNSINNEHKYNTVIPFLPQRDPLPKRKFGVALASLTALDERQSSFTHRAQKTFSAVKIRQQKTIWQEEEQTRRLERSSEDLEKAKMQARQKQKALDDYLAAQKNHQRSQSMASMGRNIPA